MSIFVPNNSGTVTFTNGSNAITGTGTAFQSYRAGSVISIPGLGEMQLAADPTSDTAAVGTIAWQGATAADKDFQYLPRNEQATFTVKLAALLEELGNGNIQAVAGLMLAADKLPYATGPGTMALTGMTAYARTLLDAADAGTALTTLGVSAYARTLLDDADAAAALTTLGGVGYTPQVKTPAEQGQARANIGADVLSGFRNKIINGDGSVNQRGITSATGGVYGFDRHKIRTQTAAVGVSSLLGNDLRLRSMMRLTQSQAAAQRMGQNQVLEGIETYALRGSQVTLGGKVRLSIAGTVRFAVLEFTGAVNTPGPNLINDWNSTSYVSGGFFSSTNLNVLAVGSKTVAANTLTDWSLLATIGANAQNIIVFYWTEAAVAQNVTLDMRWYLVEGDATTEADPFSPRHIQQELALCQRYAVTLGLGMLGRWSGANGAEVTGYAAPMRTSPSATIKNNFGQMYRLGVTGLDVTIDSITSVLMSANGQLYLGLTVTPANPGLGASAGEFAVLMFDALLLDAEL
jgi:hypothetical protein